MSKWLKAGSQMLTFIFGNNTVMFLWAVLPLRRKATKARPGSGLIIPNPKQARTQSPALGEPASHEQHQL